MFSSNNKVHTLITEQIKDVEETLIQFESFLSAATTPETVEETLRALSAGVGEAEDVADKSLRRMIDSLDGPFLPSTREDLIAIATSCDKVANKCEGIAKIVVYQHFCFPEEFAADIMEIMSISREQFSLLEESISRLFSKFGALLKDHSILDEIRALETKVDIIEERLEEAIFDSGLGLAEKMQCSRVIELICDLSDIIEDIADKIQIMLITRKA